VSTKADFIISEQDWRASVRQSQVEELLQLLQQIAPVNPQIAMTVLDLVVEAMDLPQRDELVRRIRQVTGMRDPDAEEPTPEEQAREQAQQVAQQRNDALTDATIAEKQASAKLKDAQASRAAAEVARAQAAMAAGNVDATMAALQAALQMLGTPAVVPVADQILHEAGFQSRTEQEEDARQQGVMQGEAQLQAQEQQAQIQAQAQAQAQAQQGQQQQEPQQPEPAEQQPAPAPGA
jgi:hypothetical protein